MDSIFMITTGTLVTVSYTSLASQTPKIFNIIDDMETIIEQSKVYTSECKLFCFVHEN